MARNIYEEITKFQLVVNMGMSNVQWASKQAKMLLVHMMFEPWTKKAKKIWKQVSNNSTKAHRTLGLL